MVNPLHLVRFAAVAVRSSFSEAAAELGIDQATLSRQIRQLERDLGFVLFARTTRSVALTLQGEALLPQALDLADAEQRARRRIAELVSENDSVLRFGMHPFVYWSLKIKSILDAFLVANPTATVRTSSSMSHRNLARLHAGGLDAALVLEGEDMRGFGTHFVFDTPANLLLPEEHPMAAMPELQMADVSRLQIAIFRPRRDRADFERVYCPFFEAGAQAQYVSEGTAAVGFRAATERLAMISLRPMGDNAPAGFVRRLVTDGPRPRFLLVKQANEDRGIANRFWNCARHEVLPGPGRTTLHPAP
jgi:DNA-binding transcriptional LysR family regulator